MQVGATISTIGHALVLGWTLVSFSARPFEAAPVDSLPVDIISASEFSQITAGVKTALKADVPKPLVEKLGEAKPVKDPTPKVTEKQEIVSSSAEETPPPEPTPKEPEKKAEDKKPEPKVDAIAEALKKDDAKKPDPPKPLPLKKPPQPKLDLSKIENKLALLDKREQRRNAATGATLNDKPSLGAATGNAMTLSQNEIDALRARLRDCWDVPVGVLDARDLFVVVRIQFKRDGSLEGDPAVLNNISHPAFQVAAESALRAVRKCAPYSFMPVAKYDVWKDIEVKFDPREMFRG